jgi:hypothetical protein
MAKSKKSVLFSCATRIINPRVIWVHLRALSLLGIWSVSAEEYNRAAFVLDGEEERKGLPGGGRRPKKKSTIDPLDEC